MIIPELKEILKGHINSGDAVCLFSDLASFGIPASLKEQVRNKGINFLMESYLDTLKDLVGESGLLILPTFTYSATKGETFDVQNTPSTVGSLTEYFRKGKGIVRSVHPIFSFAAWGKGAARFLQMENFDCFGESSLFQKMYDQNGTYILFGVEMQTGATYIYYSEQKMKAYYRYFKEFTGKIRDQNQERTVTFNYFVRNLQIPYTDARVRLQSEAIEKGIAHHLLFNGGPIIITKSQEIDSFIQEKVKNDRNYLIKLK